MLESLTMYSDSLMEKLLSEEAISEDEIHDVVKTATQSQSITPVFCGSAYKNKGVQPLLDAVNRYLPSPLDRSVSAKNGIIQTKHSTSKLIIQSLRLRWHSKLLTTHTAS